MTLMTKGIWKKSPKAGAKLTSIGKPLKSSAHHSVLPGNQLILHDGPKKRKRCPDGPVVIPKGLKVQVLPCAQYDHRYQSAPGARVFGAGFSAVGIGHDITTGRPFK